MLKQSRECVFDTTVSQQLNCLQLYFEQSVQGVQVVQSRPVSRLSTVRSLITVEQRQQQHDTTQPSLETEHLTLGHQNYAFYQLNNIQLLNHGLNC